MEIGQRDIACTFFYFVYINKYYAWQNNITVKPSKYKPTKYKHKTEKSLFPTGSHIKTTTDTVPYKVIYSGLEHKRVRSVTD